MEVIKRLMASIREIRRKIVNKFKWKYMVGLGVIVGTLGGISEFSGYSLSDLLPNNDKQVDYFDVSPKKNLLIFCDLSSSLNLENVQLESKKVKRIIENLPFNTEFSIYPMGLSIYQNSLLKGYIRPKTDFKAENRTIEKEKIALAEKVDSILINIYKLKNETWKAEFKSCIINSFEMTFNYLPDNDYELLKNSRVILLTDMIEQCPESSAGSIYMCSNTKQPDFEKIKNQIQEKYDPKSKLSDKIKASQLFIVMTSNYGNQQKCLTENQQREIWDLVLQKQGYIDNYTKIIRKKTFIPTTKELWGIDE